MPACICEAEAAGEHTFPYRTHGCGSQRIRPVNWRPLTPWFIGARPHLGIIRHETDVGRIATQTARIVI